jgi:hypothetical protein
MSSHHENWPDVPMPPEPWPGPQPKPEPDPHEPPPTNPFPGQPEPSSPHVPPVDLKLTFLACHPHGPRHAVPFRFQCRNHSMRISLDHLKVV